MTSLLSYTKQIPLNAGYYINVGDCRLKFLQNNGTDADIKLSTNQYALSTNTAIANVPGNSVTVISTLLAQSGLGIFRDHGKTLVSAGRVFRKVQLMVSTNSVYPAQGTDGVGGNDSTYNNYITGYLELPGQGTGSGSGGLAAPVARLG